MDAKKAFEAYVDEYADKKNKELDENEQAEKAYRANIRGVWFEESYHRTYPLNSLACDLIAASRSKKPEVLRIPTAIINPTSVGRISTTMRRPSLAPFKKVS